MRAGADVGASGGARVNPRQRRGALLLALAAIGAVAVFFSVFSYVEDVRAKLDKTTTIVRLTEDVESYEPLPGKVETREVPVSWAPEHAVRSTEELAGLVTTNSLPAGTYLQEGMLREQPLIGDDQRAVPLLVNGEMGASLGVGPGDVVDVIASFGEQTGSRAYAGFVLTCVTVLDVGSQTRDETLEDTGEVAEELVVPMTFLLDREQALSLAYARNFSEGIRLALTGRGTECDPTPAPRIFPAT